MILNWLKSRARLLSDLADARAETRLLLTMNQNQERTIRALSTRFADVPRDKKTGRFKRRQVV